MPGAARKGCTTIYSCSGIKRDEYYVYLTRDGNLGLEVAGSFVRVYLSFACSRT